MTGESGCQSRPMQKARYQAGFSNLVRPSGFEPPTPTMSRRPRYSIYFIHKRQYQSSIQHIQAVTDKFTVRYM